MSHNDYEHFADSAFDPQPAFDFEDFNAMTGRDVCMSMIAKSGEADVAAMDRSSDYDQLSPYEDMYQVQFRGGVARLSLKNAKASVEAAGLPNEAQQVRDSVMKQLGQISSPDVQQAVGSTKHRLDDCSEDRSERARNAANQRHSRKDRRDSHNSAGKRSEEDERPPGERKERYREKNRQAAAKCRDKKKKKTEELDQKYKLVAAENVARKQEVRMLRNEFCKVRELALQHATEQCSCSSLHAFNIQQAVKEASQMARTMGDMPMIDNSNDGRESPEITSWGSASTSSHGYTFPDPAGRFDYAPVNGESRGG